MTNFDEVVLSQGTSCLSTLTFRKRLSQGFFLIVISEKFNLKMTPLSRVYLGPAELPGGSYVEVEADFTTQSL